ncbi:MAG: ferredoxin [Patescibacteria group bacterium]
MQKINIDQNKCIGCGRCTEICPEIFSLDTNRKAKVNSEKDIKCAKKASDECPVEAIEVNERQ